MTSSELTGLNEEGQNIDTFMSESKNEQKEKENSAESSAETDQPEPESEDEASEDAEGSSPEEDENVPFHQHPRWKEVYAKAKKVDELEAKLTELQKPQAAPQASVKPLWFTSIYGDNEQMWQEYNRGQQEMLRRAEENVLNRLAAERQEEEKRVASANEYINDQLDGLRAEGNKFDENKLLKIMDEYRPVDASGLQWDFRRGLKIYQMLEKKASASENKKVASASGRSKTEPGSMRDPSQPITSLEIDDSVMTPSKLRKHGLKPFIH